MLISYQSNHAPLIAELRQFAAALPGSESAGAKAVAELILKATRKVMQERIYDQPLPASYYVRGKTARTGALLAGETMLQTGDGFLITTQSAGVGGKDPEEYSAWRHDASGPDWMAGRWRDMGVENVEGAIAPEFLAGMSRNIPGALLAAD